MRRRSSGGRDRSRDIFFSSISISMGGVAAFEERRSAVSEAIPDWGQERLDWDTVVIVAMVHSADAFDHVGVVRDVWSLQGGRCRPSRAGGYLPILYRWT